MRAKRCVAAAALDRQFVGSYRGRARRRPLAWNPNVEGVSVALVWLRQAARNGAARQLAFRETPWRFFHVALRSLLP